MAIHQSASMMLTGLSAISRLREWNMLLNSALTVALRFGRAIQKAVALMSLGSLGQKMSMRATATHACGKSTSSCERRKGSSENSPDASPGIDLADPIVPRSAEAVVRDPC